MGAKQSIAKQIEKQKKEVEEKLDKERKVNFSIVEAIDKIVSKILMENTSLHDILLLQDKKYCDNIVILTSKILNKHFNLREISYLNYRIKNGLAVDEMAKDKVVFMNPDEFLKLDVDHKNSQKTKKKRMCLAIAKFYIKFFHLFSTIIKSINPMYKYKDEKGVVQYIDLLKKNKLSQRELDSKNIVILGICKKRYDSLNIKNGKITDDFCRDKKISIMDKEYPGIQELKKLYYDVYQFDNSKENAGTFYKMSEEQKKLYDEDVKEFYKAMQGTDKVPETIKDFNDIFTLDFYEIDDDNTCKKDTIQKYAYNENIPLFKKYGEHLKKMFNQTKDDQKKIIGILGEMFKSVVTLKKNVGAELVISNKLNEKTLQTLVEKTRKVILNMLMNCEKNYKEGILIFKQIVKEKTIVGEEKRIERLKDKEQQVLYMSPIVMPASQSIKSETSFTKPTPVPEYPISMPQLTPVSEKKEDISESTPKFMFTKTPPSIKSSFKTEI
tara:strand:- start:143 stop:1633 length:1491 start_codon:yes stop_codon:yes gene_type:complete